MEKYREIIRAYLDLLNREELWIIYLLIRLIARK